jgi:hypothetical protein
MGGVLERDLSRIIHIATFSISSSNKKKQKKKSTVFQQEEKNLVLTSSTYSSGASNIIENDDIKNIKISKFSVEKKGTKSEA